jgi:hypothetical protein
MNALAEPHWRANENVTQEVHAAKEGISLGSGNVVGAKWYIE